MVASKVYVRAVLDGGLIILGPPPGAGRAWPPDAPTRPTTG
ncbi:hypothetical protein HMPREF3198_00106 [Winkia neuii]|nr:hypothetical protein HMPREF3198_00106 [Winkia neuii]